jgi:hypothetical protein
MNDELMAEIPVGIANSMRQAEFEEIPNTLSSDLEKESVSFLSVYPSF